jgi:acetyl esterase/lipase
MQYRHILIRFASFINAAYISTTSHTMYKKIVLLFSFFLCLLSAQAQPKVIPLYAGAAPGSESWNWKEGLIDDKQRGLQIAYNIVTPTLTVYAPVPGTANGTAMIICPGGGFHILSMNTEGTMVAEALVKKGITCFVLKYRLAHSTSNDPFAEMSKAISNNDAEKKIANAVPFAIADGRAAIAYVRQHAIEWGIRPDRIGITGFSAGGTVAASAAFNFTKENRPDFVAPVYAFMPPELIGTVNKDTPPAFLLAASDDQLQLQSHSIALYTAWNKAGIPAELHMYAKGGHGFGMRRQYIPTDTWIERLSDWLGLMGWLKR